MISNLFRTSSWTTALILLLGLNLPLSAQPKSTSKEREALQKTTPALLSVFRDVVAKPSESTVRVLCKTKEVALGTIVSEDGWILTKASQLDGPAVCKLKDGRSLEAHTFGTNEKYDLVMLKVDAKGLKPANWVESKTASAGNWVAAPGLTQDPAAIGVVSVATRDVKVPAFVPSPNSGVMGVNMSPDEDKVKLQSIEPGSGAEKAGLKANDIIKNVAARTSAIA